MENKLSTTTTTRLSAVEAKPTPLSQVLAMMRYEALLLWRSRALLVVLLALLVLSVFNVLIVNANRTTVLDALLSDGNSANLAQVIVLLTWSPLSVTLGLLMPILVADVVPKDKRTGIRELLDSLPATLETYLAGKLLGVITALFSGMGGVLLITALMWHLTIGAFDIPPYLVMYVVGVGSLIGINCSLAVLLAASQPDRRRAIGLIFFLLVIVSLLTLPNGSPSDVRLADLISPLRMPILNYFLLQDVKLAQILAAIGSGIVQVILIGLLIVRWLKWQVRQA